MKLNQTKLLFISISDVANGAEQLLLTTAIIGKAPMLFLKKEKQHCLTIGENQNVTYASKRSILLGLLKLPFLLIPYRKHYTIISTHPYLNAYLGLLKRISFVQSKLIVRECSSVFTRYNGAKKLSYKIAYQLGYLGADLVICQTELMKNDFLYHNKFFPVRNVLVKGNPIDQKAIINSALITKSDIDTYQPYLCAAGRLIPEKGFETLIRAFSIVRKSHPELNLVILGEGPERQNLMDLIDELDLKQHVLLKGWIANPMPYFKNAKGCVMSSVKEGFPNVLLQMMLLNPVVVSTICAGGIAEIPGILTVPIRNPKALATTIIAALYKKIPGSGRKKMEYLNQRNPRNFLTSILEHL
ncbi:MAG: glycosyltransferase [Pedobacter sp.]|nr:MAG: glycosyltransferase [Pedobacter sp.]